MLIQISLSGDSLWDLGDVTSGETARLARRQGDEEKKAEAVALKLSSFEHSIKRRAAAAGKSVRCGHDGVCSALEAETQVLSQLKPKFLKPRLKSCRLCLQTAEESGREVNVI